MRSCDDHLFLSIVHFFRYYAPDAPPRAGRVADPPGDQVDMGMENGLPRSFAAIDPDIETGDAGVFFENIRLELMQ